MLKAATFFKEERDPFYKRGQARGIAKERAKAKEEKLRIARDLKKEGLSLQFIAETTKLPLTVIEKL